MRVIPKTARMASLASLALVLALAGCRKANPLVPKKPVPPGTVMFHFTQKLKGPVEISLDGVRLPVAQNPKKMGRSLVIVGLAPGKHRYFLSSPRDAFGPDQGEFELEAGKGLFFASFSQHFDAVLYGSPEPTPAADGLPGVSVRLEP